MNVLFVYRAYGPELRNSVIAAQAESLSQHNVNMHFFPISSGGMKGYYRSYLDLKKVLKERQIDIVHGHYSFSAIVARLAFHGKTIASLMGSDIFQEKTWVRILTILFSKFMWDITIVKSREMRKIIKNAEIIANGVDFGVFKPLDKQLAQQRVGFDPQKRHVIFVAEKIQDNVKNFRLAEKAMLLLTDLNIDLHAVSGVTQKELVDYYNAADVLLLTSISEGSPNVVKEAMACNCPVVSTDVGDVSMIIGKTEGCYITSFSAENVALKIRKAIAIDKRTTGREDIRYLDSLSIAQKIIGIYESMLEK